MSRSSSPSGGRTAAPTSRGPNPPAPPPRRPLRCRPRQRSGPERLREAPPTGRSRPTLLSPRSGAAARALGDEPREAGSRKAQGRGGAERGAAAHTSPLRLREGKRKAAARQRRGRLRCGAEANPEKEVFLFCLGVCARAACGCSALWLALSGEGGSRTRARAGTSRRRCSECACAVRALPGFGCGSVRSVGSGAALPGRGGSGAFSADTV